MSSYHIAVVVLPLGTDRAAVRASLAAAGVQTSVHYPPIHQFSSYASEPQRPLPATDSVSGRLLTLPLYPHLSEDAVDVVATRLRASLDDPPGPLSAVA